MNGPRYQTRDESHVYEMEASVLDTELPVDQRSTDPWRQQVICVCWSQEDAERIARALNHEENP